MLPLLIALAAVPHADPTAPTSATAQVQVVMDKAPHPIPFEWLSGHIVFQAEIGGERVWTVLDTGAGHDVIDTALARRLKLAAVPMNKTVHATGGHDVPLVRVDDVPLLIAGAFGVRAPMMALDLGFVPTARGIRVQAVLGQNLLAHMIVLVDKRSGQLRLFRGTMTPHGDVQPIAVSVVGDRDRVTASVAGKPLTLTIDTGDDGGVSLSPAAWARVAPADAQRFEWKGQGAAGIADTEGASRVPLLTLGGTSIADVQVRVAPQSPADADGRIGMGCCRAIPSCSTPSTAIPGSSPLPPTKASCRRRW